MIRASSAISLLIFAFAAPAEEPPAVGIPPDRPLIPSAALPESYPATFIGGPAKAAFANATPAVSVAMCGVEAHGAETDLDAGLIDLNVPDPARAAGGVTEEAKIRGSNARDYHSAITLGITLGYRF